MGETTTNRIAGIVAREWWVVVAAIVASALVATLASAAMTPRWVGTANMRVNTAVLARYNSLLHGDRMLVVLASDDYRDKVAKLAGVTEEEVAGLTASGAGRNLDEVTIRYVGSDEERVEELTDKFAKATIEFAQDYNDPELLPLARVIDETQASVDRVREIQDKVDGEPYREGELEVQLIGVERDLKNSRLQLEQARAAYNYDGTIGVEQARGSRRSDAIAAGVLLGLVGGLIIAVLRERSLAVSNVR